MATNKKQTWLREFTEFSNVDPEIQVPPSLLQELKKRFFPNPWVVFGKLILVHASVGSLSLAICHQFGLNPFQTDQSLADWFMRVGGLNFCMLFCGVFFMTATYLFSNLLLTLEELESVKRSQWVQTGVLGFLSLAAFYFLGAQIAGTIVFYWIAGVMLGGLLSIEGSYRIRRAIVWA